MKRYTTDPGADTGAQDVIGDQGVPTPIVSDVDELKKQLQKIIDWDLKRLKIVYEPTHQERLDWILEDILPLITAYTHDRETEVRADEWSNICTEVGLFTKKRDKQVYNVYLPIDYIIKRVAALKATRKDGVL